MPLNVYSSESDDSDMDDNGIADHDPGKLVEGAIAGYDTDKLVGGSSGNYPGRLVGGALQQMWA